MKHRKRILILLFFLIGILNVYTVASADDGIYVYFLDVGQADATVIQCGGKTMMIDFGDKNHSKEVCNFVEEELGIDCIDIAVITHAHQDHIGALSELIGICDNIYIQRASIEQKEVKPLIERAYNSHRGAVIYIVPSNSDFRFSKYECELGEAKVTVIAPKGDVASNLNNVSLIVKVNYKGKVFLFPGDSEVSEQNAVKKFNLDLNADVLHAPHHGGVLSNDFLSEVKPEYVIISVGKDNQHKHPNQLTLDLLLKEGIQIYRTDESHTIMCYSDGKSIEITENYQN